MRSCPSCRAPAEDDARFCHRCGAPVIDTPRPEVRKSIVTLFIDLVDSTVLGERLDPELLRSVLDQYFLVCVNRVEAFGGAVEKFIGDAVMAVFGIPRTREDDALRAVRTATSIRDALTDLDHGLAATGVTLRTRTGIASGEVVVTSFPNGDLHVVGDAVNTAARLQSAAGPGQIIFDDRVASMVRGLVTVDEIAPLALKGKARRTRAWRLVSLANPEPSGPTTPFVGRDDETAQLRYTYRRAVSQDQSCLVTVVGDAGVGKSRLVREFLTDHVGTSAQVLVGHCRSYGGGTYDPVIQMLGSLTAGQDLEALLGDGADSVRARRCLAVLATPSHADRGDGVREIAWAVRKLFELLARRRPLVVVVEDLHEASSTLLDLIDDVASWLTDVPMLLVCVARPDLLDARPAWGGGKSCAITLDVPPLTETETARLVLELTTAGEVAAQLDDGSAAQVVTSCDGNPLFAEIMVDLLRDGRLETSASPNINALLSARLDQLPADERAVLERAAVIGREFSLALLRVLIDDLNDELGQCLARLARRRLVRRTDAAGRFRFAQTLVRDTLYSMIPKAHRQQWHLTLADITVGEWEDEALPAVVAGHHLEAAYVLRRELQPGDPSLPALAGRAAAALLTDGTIALQRRDLPAAAATLSRAQELLPPGEPRHRSLALRISDCWLSMSRGQLALDALTVAEEAMPGDPPTAASCLAQRLIVAVHTGVAIAQVVSRAAELNRQLEATSDDDLTWCRFHQLSALLYMFAEELGAAEAALRSALVRARAAGDGYEEERILIGMCELALWGPTPVHSGLALCDELTRRFVADRVLLVPVATTEAGLRSLIGDIDGARALLSTAQLHVRELHLDLAGAVLAQTSGVVESLARNHEVAESHFLHGAAALRSAGRVTGAQTLEAWAAREMFSRGLLGEATRAIETLERDAHASDVRTQLIVRSLRGRLLSSAGAHEAALTALGGARALAGRTDDMRLQGDVLLDLAIVLRAAGHVDDALRVGAEALNRYTAKGADLLMTRVTAWLAAPPASSDGGTP
ncbi:ATP-binding protein [Micromonospora sp. MS34]|uniref:ATP-binding protein n=1 Tax=Micromonospora sp. MS34 TaxID=3385971 RepID=UPI0039A3B1DC